MPDVAAILYLVNHLQLPSAVDRSVYQLSPDASKQLCTIGSHKPVDPGRWDGHSLQPWRNRWHCWDHLVTHVAACTHHWVPPVPTSSQADAPAQRRQRVGMVSLPSPPAAYLAMFDEAELRDSIIRLVEGSWHIGASTYELCPGLVNGNILIGRPREGGRKCPHCPRRHASNAFGVTLLSNGMAQYTCRAAECSTKAPLQACWVQALVQHLPAYLQQAFQQPSEELDPDLLRNAEHLVLAMLGTSDDPAKQRKSYAQHRLWPEVAGLITDYVHSYVKFIRQQGVYIFERHSLADPQHVISYVSVKHNTAIANLTSPYKFAWDTYNSHRSPRHELLSIDWQPVLQRILPGNKYNMFSRATTDDLFTRESFTSEDADMLQPILELQRDYLCGGVAADYEYFLDWQAHVFQRPTIKTGVSAQPACGASVSATSCQTCVASS